MIIRGPVGSPRIQKYFEDLKNRLNIVYDIAKKARAKGLDPEPKVDIPLAASIADRVEALIGSTAPQIIGKGIPKRIAELEKEYGPGDWRVALKIAEEIADEKFCKFDTKLKAIATGIRTGLAYTTQGVVSAPLEGLAEIRLRKRQDDKEYLSIYFGGPIRGAGGTQQAVSLLIADYVRRKCGIFSYDPTPDEIKRFYVEVTDYYERVERKQYKPTEREIELIIKSLPVEINGDPSTELEVSNYKNLPRVETNRIRSGLSLVLTDGLPLKAEKLWKQIEKWGKDFGLEDWKWLKEFIKLKKSIRTKPKEGDDEAVIKPNYYYLSESVAGRAVFAYPSTKGGFRVRYGRSRMTGDGSWAVSPATMIILNEYIAFGTQLRTEHPGKSTALTQCDSIDGPIIKLKDGSVVKVNNVDQAKELRKKIEEIIFIGDILISHGDFAEQGSRLMPAGYCPEFWFLEVEEVLDERKKWPLEKEILDKLKQDSIKTQISAEDAIKISEALKVPLHPEYTYHWNDISAEDFNKLGNWLEKGKLDSGQGPKRVLELIGCPHRVLNGKVELSKDDSIILQYILKSRKNGTAKTALELINSFSQIKMRDKSGTFIGARMGRPEKAKMRTMKGTPHVLFPVGTEGGRLRNFISALGLGKITADWVIYECLKCQSNTIYPLCENCGKKTKQVRLCLTCKKRTTDRSCHGPTRAYERKMLDPRHYLDAAKKQLHLRNVPPLIKGIRGTSNKDHIPENMAKGILRSLYNLYVNKDGTIRYDVTELGITHFKPGEIGLSVEKAKEFGYDKDIHGKALESLDQIVEIFPQDILLPACPDSQDEGADKILPRIAKFVDHELKDLYGLKPYYGIKNPSQLIGQIVIGLAPHTSAGIIGRIIGFSKTQTLLAHPYWHDAQRRDLDGEETSIILAMDAFLNFSRQYLPDKRGSRSMDAPLVVTTILNPEEIDDEVYDVDTVWKYPLEFYLATLEYKQPWDIKIEQIRDRVGKPEQYEGLGYTHKVSDLNLGPQNSAYKRIPAMLEKLEGQLDLAKKIRAVELSDVAQLVIDGHFIRDIKGNLRKFTTQGFRCVYCNAKYRRVPLSGRCTKCSKGKLVFTIAEGTIKKYMEPSIKLAQLDDVPPYLRQSLMIIKRRIDSIFGEEKTKQVGLGGFMDEN